MNIDSANDRFFRSTRGQVLRLLRKQSLTVNELAEALKLTDNAVRAHLATLERDGLVHSEGFRASIRKPNVVYALTPLGEAQFPKAYLTLFNRLLGLLRNRGHDLDATMGQLGADLAASAPRGVQSEDVEQRVARAVAHLAQLGGLAQVERQNGDLIIEGFRCPFAASVAEHPEVCTAATEFVRQIVDRPVREECDHARTRCRFRIAASGGEKTG